MFWFRKEKPAPFAVERHLAAAKSYIAERLVVPEPPKPKVQENTHIRYSDRDVISGGDRGRVQSSARRHVYDDPVDLRKQYLMWEVKQRSRSTFSNKVLTLLDRKGIEPRAFYRQAGIDRKLFSKLKTDFCYQPKKETALRCCLALRLKVDEALDLLKSAGYTLSDSSSFDLAIRYCLANEVYDLSAVNMLLEALDEKAFD